jgi:sec-independent protein translocase protein TatA
VFLRDLLQPWHLLIVLAIILLVFGPGKLSGLGSALGSSIRDFKKATREDDEITGATDKNGNVKSVADDDGEVVHALPAKSIVMESAPMARKQVDLDDEPVAVGASRGEMDSAAPIKIGTTRRGYNRR